MWAMSKRTWLTISAGLGLTAAVLGIAWLQGVSVSAQTPPSAKGEIPETSVPVAAPGEKAWAILRDGIKDKSADKRALAVRARAC